VVVRWMRERLRRSAFTTTFQLCAGRTGLELERVVIASCVMPTTVTFTWAANGGQRVMESVTHFITHHSSSR